MIVELAKQWVTDAEIRIKALEKRVAGLEDWRKESDKAWEAYSNNNGLGKLIPCPECHTFVPEKNLQSYLEREIKEIKIDTGD